MGLTKFLLRSCCIFVLLLTLGCSKDSDDPADPDNFYNGAVSNASSSDLVGYWAIFEAEYEGTRVPVPINYSSCGRDFFIYRDSGAYQEYLYTSSGCETINNQLQWQLSNGVITLSTASGSTEDLVVIKLTNNELQFKARVDIDEDGKLDVVVLIAKRYVPNEVDFLSQTFQFDQTATNENLIRYTWEAYDGFHTFDRYEIYRSSGDNCSKASAELMATITNVNETTFTDLTPPASNRLCYYLKIYTDKGLLGESYLNDINPSIIRIDPVNLNQPTVVGSTIELSWAASESPYFSHYEILVANHEPGSGYGYQELSLATISGRETTTWVDENPPYLENPYYYIRTYNIFGNFTEYSTDVTMFWQVPFKRQEVLPLQLVKSYTIDPEESVVYFWGQESGEGSQPYNIRRFNYDTHQTENISDISPSSDTAIPIKLIVSPNGKEIVVHQGVTLHFYDAMTMQFKYEVDPEGVFSIQDFNYDPLRDIWVISDGDDIFTLQRDNANMFLIDTTPHFANHQGGGRYEFIILKNGQIILGHSNEPTSYVYDLDVNGNFTGNQSVNIQFRALSQYSQERLLYSETGDFLMDTQQNRLFSSLTFQNTGSFEKPNFPTGISLDGTKIYGSDNDYSWSISNESPHQKQAIIYDRNTMSTIAVETVGYPHILFENHNGEVISISSGFKKETLYRNVNDAADIFVEKVQVP